MGKNKQDKAENKVKDVPKVIMGVIPEIAGYKPLPKFNGGCKNC